jgi:hypothetical protein
VEDLIFLKSGRIRRLFVSIYIIVAQFGGGGHRGRDMDGMFEVVGEHVEAKQEGKAKQILYEFKAGKEDI